MLTLATVMGYECCLTLNMTIHHLLSCRTIGDILTIRQKSYIYTTFKMKNSSMNIISAFKLLTLSMISRKMAGMSILSLTEILSRFGGFEVSTALPQGNKSLSTKM